MIEMNNNWDMILDSFRVNHPFIFDEVVDWYPSGQLEITVRLRNDDKYAYTLIGNGLRQIYSTEDIIEDIEEMEFRKRFSFCLMRKLNNVGMTQDQLAEASGISKVMISKYITCKATPSYYNVDRIARALRCGVSELEVRR